MIDIVVEAFKAGGFSLALFALCVGGIVAVYRGSIKREKDMGKRIEAVTEKMINLQSGIIAQNIEAMNRNSEALNNKARVDERILEALRARPCLIETNKYPAIQKPEKTPLPQTYPR